MILESKDSFLAPLVGNLISKKCKRHWLFHALLNHNWDYQNVTYKIIHLLEGDYNFIFVSSIYHSIYPFALVGPDNTVFIY